MVWLQVLAVAAVGLIVVLGDITVPIINHWTGGFQAKACFTVPQNINSWKVHLTFSQPINTLDIFTAHMDSVSADKKQYVVSTMPWNAVQHTGNQLCIDMLGHTSGDISPTLHASLEGVTDGGTNVHATATPTVSHVTHTAAGTTHTQVHATTHAAVAHTTTHGAVAHTTTHAAVAHPTTAHGVSVETHGGNTISSTMELRNDYGTSFEGWFDFIFPSDFEGWVMKIHFSKPVSELQPSQARIISHNADGTEWTLSNDDNTLYVKAGSHFQLRTVNKLASGASHGAPTATAVMINMGRDNWTVHELANKQHSKYNYYDALMKSILFYEAQRSGKLPANNRIPWRGDSALHDHGANGEDLTGGWYDAGDFVKFNMPMAWATVILEWGYLMFKDAYRDAGQTQWMLESIKWPLDYLLKCHVANQVLYAQVGNGGIDHSSWGRPEEMTMERPAYKIDVTHPGSDLAMETAAAFAAGYLVFKDTSAAYASKLLQHARTLWDFAIAHQGKYSAVVPAAGFYDSVNVTDEHCWGSLWLYKATGEQKYLDTAKHWYDSSPDWGMSWDDVIIGNQILMYNLTGEAHYKADIEGTFRGWFPGGSVPYTPKGLPFRLQWGSLRYASNMAFAALAAAENGIHPVEYRHWAMCLIHYALGDAGHSFVVGFGKNPPVAPHHRSSSCPWAPALCNLNIVHIPTPNVHTLFGALVGGPGQADDYKDTRENYVNNEVANDYNAGFQSAVAGLLHLLLIHQHPEQTGHSTCPYR